MLNLALLIENQRLINPHMNRLLALLVTVFMAISANAFHIIGGDMYVTHVDTTAFQVTLILYRDCDGGGAQLDSDLEVTVYENVTNLWRPDLTFGMSLGQQTFISLGDNCFTPDICLEQGTYTTIVNLPESPNGFYLSWERCCRNSLIDNIENPDDIGMVFTVSVPPSSYENSTPQFDEYPIDAYFCVNGINSIDFGAIDIDGDSLVYSLDTPLKGDGTGPGMATLGGPAGPKPYSTATWAPGYSLANIVGGAPPMTINSQTGLISASPDMVGRFVFAVKIEEYRDGAKIGEIRREIQFVSFICPTDVPSIISWDENSDPVFTIQPNKPFCVEIKAEDVNLGDTLFLFANSEILDTAFTPTAAFTPVVGNGEIVSDFCWLPNCDMLSSEPYTIDILAFSSGCTDSTFTSVASFDIMVELPPDEPTEYLLPGFSDQIYVASGEENCFFVQANDIDCYDTLTLSVDTTTYIFEQAQVPGTFQTVKALNQVFSEFCWKPLCEDVSVDVPYIVDINIDARKCDVINSFPHPVEILVFPETDGNSEFPNVFTPNNDEFNEVFRVKEPYPTDFCVENFLITVYNRWGDIVYESSDPDFEWDGNHFESDQDCSEGVYYYVVDYDIFGFHKNYTGNVSLAR